MTTWPMQLHHEATMVRRSLDFDFFKRRKLKPLKKPEADKIEEAVFDDGFDDDDDDDHDALLREDLLNAISLPILEVKCAMVVTIERYLALWWWPF